MDIICDQSMGGSKGDVRNFKFPRIMAEHRVRVNLNK